MASIVDQLNDSINNHLNDAEVHGDTYHTLYTPFARASFHRMI